MQVLANLDMTKNQLLNAVFQNLTTAPATPTEGQYYYNTTDKKLYIWNGTAWAASAMTGEEIVAAINAAAAVIDLDNLPAAVGTTITKVAGIEAGAQVNVVLSVAGRTGAVVLTKTDVGLSNVTNDAQVKKIASSTNGYIPTWSGTTGDALAAGYAVETTLTGSSSAIPRADAVKAYVDALLGANDAMVFKGTLGTGGTITAIPTTYSAGWTYRVITAGTYAGIVCEVGDLIVAIIDRSGTGNLNTDWTVVQTNVDGAVVGPASSTNGNFPIFSGTTGKLIANSTYGPSSFATAAHNHDGTYPKKYSTTIGGATAVVVTHNLNSRELAVTIRTTASPYDLVMADVEFTTTNTLTVRFATAPAAGAYTITVIG